MKQIVLIWITGMFIIGGIGLWQFGSSSQAMEESHMDKMDDMTMPTARTAVLAGGCFWCTEPPFDNAYWNNHSRKKYRYPKHHHMNSGRLSPINAIPIPFYKTSAMDSIRSQSMLT